MKMYNREVEPWELLLGAALGAAIGVVYLLVAAAGYVDAVAGSVVTVFLGTLLVHFLARHQARRLQRAAAPATGPVRTHRIQATAKLPHPPEAVWALLYPAENAPLMSPKLTRGYRVPGTPEGLGEQQAAVHDDGSTTIVEIVEHQPPRRAVVKVMTPRFEIPVRNTWDIEPLGAGCLLTMGTEYDAPASVEPTGEARRAAEIEMHSSMDRVRRALDAPNTQPSAEREPPA